MCGISGFVGRGDRSDLIAMTRAQAHRGPDDEGFHVEPEHSVYLGHRRLTIRDAAGGAQPMWNEDHSVCIVFNGEIYNCAELRQELSRHGHIFASSHSDTEVLVHGYEQWGNDLPLRLNGMFAFAIFDRKRRRLFLARDRFGEKPLYYFQDSGLFAFASELSALIRHSAIPANVSDHALRKLFGFGYIPQPDALYERTFKLPAGHFLELDVGKLSARVTSYWRFRLEPEETMAGRPEADLVDELGELITRSAERRLVSDVPVGVFLSGGIDSSTVLATVATLRDRASIKAFTIGFTEPSFDESGYARTVANHIGVDHKLRILDLEQSKAILPSLLSRMDEPLGDPSILPTYLLSEFAREEVTVALSGDGGDELFAGYDPFDALEPAILYSKYTPTSLHQAFRWLADCMPVSDRNMSFDFKLRRMLMGLSYPEGAWAPAWMAPLEVEQHGRLFARPSTLAEVYGPAMQLWSSCGSRDPFDRLMEFFTTYYLQDDILTKVDRATMMTSLESRAIFLDNDLVDFCRRLPRQFKYRNGQRKYLLRKLAERMLPPEIVNRPKKGFGIPAAAWLRHMQVSPEAATLDGIRPDFVESAWTDHRDRRADNRIFLWTWMSLQAIVASQRSAELAA